MICSAPATPKRPAPRGRRHRATFLAAAAATTVLTPLVAQAVTRTWINTNDGSWNTASLWSPSGVPSETTVDDALISRFFSSNVNVTFNRNYTAAKPIGTLTLNSSTTSSLTFQHTLANTNLFATTITVGTTGRATYAHSASTSTVSDSLILADATGSLGAYSLSGSASLSTYQTYVGYNGTGTFAQSGGSHSVNFSLDLGYGLGATGAYSLTGGTLSTSYVHVGGNGTGTFTQTGGSHSGGNVYLGNSPSSSGTYLHSGGTTDLNELYLGYGVAAASTGSYSLSGSASLHASSQYVGATSAGSFAQSGGTNTVDLFLLLGYDSGASGTYSLTGGSLSTFVTDVGENGQGSFLHSAGSHTISAELHIGSTAGGTGSYSLSGTGSLAVSGDAHVGGKSGFPGGAGSLSISGGSASVAGALKVYDTPGTSLSLSGGALSVASLDTSGNPARLTWTAGTLSFTSTPPTISPTGPLGPSLKLAPGMTLRTTSLPSIAPSSSLDISGGTLLVAHTGPSPADALRSLLQTGRILSSSAAADPHHLLAIGYVDTPALLTARLALTGDANLDGAVNADDYTLLDKSSAQHLANPHWTDGDFNYDGAVDAQDYLLIDRTLGQAQGFSPGVLSLRESQFGPAYVSSLLASVPEPSSLAACLVAALPLLRRRRA